MYTAFMVLDADRYSLDSNGRGWYNLLYNYDISIIDYDDGLSLTNATGTDELKMSIEKAQKQVKGNETEERYLALYMSLNEGFYLAEILYDDNGQPYDYRYVEVNPTFEHIMGLSRDQIIGRTYRETVPNPSLDWLEVFRNVALTGTPADYNFNSTAFHRHFEVHAFRPAKSQFAGLIKDITSRKQMEDAQLFLLQCGWPASGEDFFDSLARYLAETLDMDFVCIDRLSGDLLEAKTLAVYFDGKFEDNVSYTLKDTPCGDVVGKTICSFPSGVRHLFPQDTVLQEMMAEGYAGTTLWSSQGQPIGLIALISRKPLANIQLTEAILNLAAIRAAGELERKHTEEALSELAQRLNSHMQNSPLAVIEWDPDYRIIRWSDEAERVFGWTADEMLGKRIDDIRWVYEEDWPIVVKLMEDMNAGVRPRNVNPNRNYRKDGSIIYCEWYNSVLQDESGEVTSVLSLVLNVTDRELAQRNLTEAQAHAERHAAQLDSFFSNMTEGAVLHDSEGNLVLANEAALRITGDIPTRVEDRVQRFQIRRMDGTPMAPEEAPSQRGLRGETIKELRCKLTASDGKETVLAVSASPVRASDNQVVGVTTVFRDISDQAEFEQEKEDLFNREHHIAHVLQQAILPPDVPSHMMGYTIAVKYRPALKEAEIGGDFYDVFDLGDNRFAIVIGDVVGKGLGAAIRVASARHTIRSYAYLDPRPARVLTLVNNALCKDAGDESQMLTLFYAVVDPAIGGMMYANAGHESPVVCSAQGHCEELRIGGIPFGVLSGFEYEQANRRLEEDDVVVLVTDGITEARSSGPFIFGSESVVQFVKDHPNTSPEELAEGLMHAATAHAGGVLQDDAAVVVFSPSEKKG